ncbi:hypothetical protein [Arthrobacter sp. MA-N2]|uniref:hypothetical protein n=1 Tax=Arthrobacter sp. MA-N2 TaxID=1101188 RepID=UPI00047FB181|nr:hypothetical protein [Arthrobacter sp. MA-N2]
MSMTRGKIELTKAAARSLIIACDALLERLDAERVRYDHQAKRNVTRPKSDGDYSYGSPESGALRRRSMDVTRILADLRK